MKESRKLKISQLGSAQVGGGVLSLLAKTEIHHTSIFSESKSAHGMEGVILQKEKSTPARLENAQGLWYRGGKDVGLARMRKDVISVSRKEVLPLSRVFLGKMGEVGGNFTQRRERTCTNRIFKGGGRGVQTPIKEERGKQC